VLTAPLALIDVCTNPLLVKADVLIYPALFIDIAILAFISIADIDPSALIVDMELAEVMITSQVIEFIIITVPSALVIMVIPSFLCNTVEPSLLVINNPFMVIVDDIANIAYN
jgi:hypothetical protein